MAEETRTVRVTVETEVGDAIKQLRAFQKELAELEEQKHKVTRKSDEWKVLENKISDCTGQVKRQSRELKDYFKGFTTGKKSLNELGSAQNKLNRIVRELDPSTLEWKEYAGILNQVKKRMASLQKEFQNTDAVMCTMSSRAEKVKNYIFGFGEAIGRVKDKLQDLTQEYLAYSDAQADVMKTTGLTQKEVEELGSAFKRIDTRSSRNELMELAATAGKLGITGKEDVEAFVRAADQINVALGEDLGEGAIREIGKISDVFGLTDTYGIEQAYLKIGSAINSLGQSSTASEAYLVDFTQRLAGVAKQAGISVEQILGYGSALDQNGQKVEMAATAFQGFITKIFSDPAQFARIAHMEVGKFTQLLQTDANAAIRAVLTSLNQQGGFQQLIPVFESMNLDGSRAVSVLASMASNIQAVDEAQQVANASFLAGTSITDEFAVKNNNAAAKVEKMRNDLTDLRVEIGQNLLPVLLGLGNAANSVVGILSGLINVLSNNKRVLVSVASAVSLLAAQKYNLFKKISLAVVALKNFVVQGKLAAALGSPFKAMGHLAHAGFLLVSKGTKRAAVAMRSFNRVVASNPIGLVITAIAALGVGIASLIRKTTEGTRTFRKFEASVQTETAKIDTLFETLKKAEKGTRDYATAKKAIIDQYGEYLQGLMDERGELKNVEEAQKRVTAAIKDRWAQEQLGKRKDEINNASFEKQVELTEKIRKRIEGTTNPDAFFEAIKNFDGDYVVRHLANTANEYVTVSEEFRKLLDAYGYQPGLLETRVGLAGMAHNLRYEEERRQSDIQVEESRYASFFSDFELKNQLAQAKKELQNLENQKQLAPVFTPILNLSQIDAQIEAAKNKVAILKNQLNPVLENPDKATATGTVIPLNSTGGDGLPSVEEQARTAKKASEARLKELKAGNDRAQKALEEAIEKGRQAQMSADELEIAHIREKYDKEIALAAEYKDRLQAILADPDASAEEKAYAEMNLMSAVQRMTDLSAIRDHEITTTKDRQEQDHWAQWNTLANTDYGNPAGRERRDAEIEKVDQWASEEKDRLGTAFDALALEEGSAAYLEQYQLLKDRELAIDEAANEQKLQIETDYQNERLGKIAEGVQMAQYLLSNASNIVGQLKDLELQKSTAIYDKEKESLDKMLKNKQISQESYNIKMEKLEEEKQEREKQIRKKYLLAEFAMQVAQITATTALSVMKAFEGGLPFMPMAIAQAAVASAFGAMQIGIAAAQYNIAKGYSKGGFTPQGGKEEPAGIVHKGEYVVPQWVLRTPQGMNYVQLLEAIRTNRTTGYLRGGAVETPLPISGTLPELKRQTEPEDSALRPLLESIDRKLNGVSLVYLDRQLKDLHATYERTETEFGVKVR